MRRITHITHYLIFSPRNRAYIPHILLVFCSLFQTQSMLSVRSYITFILISFPPLTLMNCNERESDALCVSLLMHVLFVSRQPAPASAPASIHQHPSLLPSVHFYFSLSLLSSWSYSESWFSSWNQTFSFRYRHLLLATIIVIVTSIFILSRR